jgi:hypothetical protein
MGRATLVCLWHYAVLLDLEDSEFATAGHGLKALWILIGGLRRFTESIA